MKRSIVFAFLLGLALTTFGQTKLGLKLGVGPAYRFSTWAITDPQYKFRVVPGFGAGIFFNTHISERSQLGADLLFNQVGVRFRQEYDIPDQNGEIIGNYSGYLQSYVWYVSLPILYSIRFKGLYISLGIQTSHMITGNERHKGQMVLDGEITTWDLRFYDLDLDKIEIGPKVELSYSLSDRIDLQATYSFGINNLYPIKASVFTVRNHQLLVTVRFDMLPGAL